MAEKTEAPTPRRLAEARKEGNIAVSSPLVQAGAFVAALALLPTTLRLATSRFHELLQLSLMEPRPEPTDLLFQSLRAFVFCLLPLLAAGASGAVVVGLLQTRGLFTLARLRPDLAHLSPVTGFARLFQPARLFAVLRALTTALFVGWVGWGVLRTLVPRAHLADGEWGLSLSALAEALQSLLWKAAAVGLALAVADYLVTRHSWWKKLHMTPAEVKREHREQEGNPELKAARRRAHQEALRGAALAALRDATVLIVNPTHLATALRYREELDEAPLILAQGQGEWAQQLRRAAEQLGVPVVHDVPVAQALRGLEEGERIPEALFEAVALILHELWQAEQGAAAAAEGRATE